MTYAITVRQPHAAAIIHGSKTTESRSWRTSYRGRLYIHAGARQPGQAAIPASLAGLPLVLGAIIGYVSLTGITGRQGAWTWHLAGPVAIEPVPCRGRLGLWPYVPPLLHTDR